MIDEAAVVRKSLAHVGLVTEALTTPEDSVWLPKKSTLRGPPDELFPPDGQGPPATGPRAGHGSALPDEPLFDEPPAEDRAAQLGDRRVCRLAKPCADRADQLELM